MISTLRPGAGRRVRATNVRNVGDCGQFKDVRSATIFKSSAARNTLCLIVVLAVFCASRPVCAAHVLATMVDRYAATRHAIESVSCLVINYNRGHVRSLGLACHSKRSLTFGPITCLREARRRCGRSAHGVLRISKGYRASDRANEYRRDYGEDDFRSRFTSGNGGRRGNRRSVSWAFRGTLSANVRVSFYRWPHRRFPGGKGRRPSCRGSSSDSGGASANACTPVCRLLGRCLRFTRAVIDGLNDGNYRRWE